MKEAIRHFIIKQARKLFEENGFNNTTVEEIAQAAEVSKPTVYKYFTSKEVLLLNVVDQMNGEMEEILLPIFSDPGSFALRLREIIQKMLGYIYANRGIFRLAVSEVRIILQALGDEHEGMDWFIKKRENRLSHLEEFFAVGIREGTVRGEFTPEFLAHFFLGSLNEYHLGHLLRHDTVSEPDIVKLSDSIMNVMTEGFVRPDHKNNNLNLETS